MELTGIEGRMTEKVLKHKILKGCLEINMRLWDDNIKMNTKGTRFVFRPNYSPQNGAKREFWTR
jgi:hypothetical protein